MGFSNGLSYETGSFSHHWNSHRFLQPEALQLYFPRLEPWVVQFVLLPSCSPQLICMQMWDTLVSWQLPPCCVSSPTSPGCPSLPLLAVWVNVSSLTPWLLDFHALWFSGSSGFFVCLFVLICCYLSLGCVEKWSISTYTSILTRLWNIYTSLFYILKLGCFKFGMWKKYVNNDFYGTLKTSLAV